MGGILQPPRVFGQMPESNERVGLPAAKGCLQADDPVPGFAGAAERPRHPLQHRGKTGGKVRFAEEFLRVEITSGAVL